MKKLQINWGLWVQGLLFVAAVVIIIGVAINIGSIFSAIGIFFGVISPVIAAAAIAYMLSRPCEWIEKWIRKTKYKIIEKRARGLAVLAVYVIAIGIIYALFRTLLPLLFSNILEFVDFIPELYNTIETFILEIEWDELDEMFNIAAMVEEFFADFDIQTVVGPATQLLGDITNFATNFAIGTAMWLFEFVLAVIISIYILIYKNTIFATIGRIIKLMMKAENMQTLGYYIKKADELFYKFIGAQFLDSCIMGAGSILLLWILNVRFAVALGILLGVANMIPKFGSIIASVVVIILTLITGNINQAILTGILLTIWQQIDGNVIGPMIMGDALKINPILIFISLLVGAHYFGVLGMFLSIPVMTLIKIIIMNIIEAKETMQHHSDQVAFKIGQEKERIKVKGKLKIKSKKPESPK